MIYVNQSKRNRYLKLTQFFDKNKKSNKNENELNDDEDIKDYELLAKTIKDNTDAYNSRLTYKNARHSHRKKFSSLGQSIVTSLHSKVATSQDGRFITDFNQEFVTNFKKAIIFNKDTLSNYKACIKKIDDEVYDNQRKISEEEEKVPFSADEPRQTVQFISVAHSRKNSFNKEDISYAETSANLAMNSNVPQVSAGNSNSNENNSQSGALTKEQAMIIQNKAHMNEMKQKRKRILQSAIRYLVSNGIKVTDYMKKNPFHDKPFYLRNSDEFFDAVKFNNVEIVEQAMKCNKEYLFEYDYYKQTAFHWAAKLGNKEVLSVLLENGKCVNQYDNKMRTPLFLAAMNDQEECVRLLLQHGGNPQLGDVEGRKPVDVTTNERIKKDIIQAIDKIYGDNKKEML